ncbi:hypothetical protein [Lentibacter sp.]|uniref:hypothetical protein n=1 Tax=Lentibacter sp. TaxID=2024994 RepID=UPI003F6A3B1A
MTLHQALSHHQTQAQALAQAQPHTQVQAMSATLPQGGMVSGEAHALQALPPLRLFHVFAGAVLLVAAVGLWAVPGSTWNQSAQLMKLFLTISAALTGLALIAPMRRSYPEVTLDPRAERLDVIERNDFGRISKKTTYSYDQLSEVDVRDGVFIARDHHGRRVVELPLGAEVEALDALRAALGPSFARTA